MNTDEANRRWTSVLLLGDGVCGRSGVCVRQNQWTNEGSVMKGVTHSLIPQGFNGGEGGVTLDFLKKSIEEKQPLCSD